MTWESLYLICFVVGFASSILALLGGTLHLPLRNVLHLPHPGGGRSFLHGVGHVPHGPASHGHVAAGSDAASGGEGAAHVSPYNFATLMAFLAWFGGTGYLLTDRSRLGALLILGVASVIGAGGAAVIFSFLTKVLLAHERSLDAADFEMAGVLGKVSAAIRPEGTGEIIYSQAGTRRSAGARGDNGAAIPRGAEILVTRFEKGIAYVRLWEDLAGDMARTPGPEIRLTAKSPAAALPPQEEPSALATPP